MSVNRDAGTRAAQPKGLSREETALAYAAMFVLAAAIAFTIGAILVG